jgi:hypothetical protein
MLISCVPIKENRDYFNKNNTHSTPVMSQNYDKQTHNFQKNPPNLDNYPMGEIKTDSKIADDIPNKINQTVIHGLQISDIAVGKYQLTQAMINPLDIVAKKLNGDSKTIVDTIKNAHDFKNTYASGLKFAGIASMATGLASLIRFTAGIVDIYQDTHHKNDVDTEKRRTVMRDITAGTELISATGNLIGVRGMASALTNPQAISQAVSSFGGGAIASAHAVTAIHMGIGLLATGITVASLATMMNCGRYFANRFNGKINDTHDTSKHSDIISGTTQLLNGIGNMILLNTPSGFTTHELLNRGEAFMNIYENSKTVRLFTGLSTGLMMLGGTQSLVNAFSTKKTSDVHQLS